MPSNGNGYINIPFMSAPCINDKSVAHFLKYTYKPIDTIFFAVFSKKWKNYSSSTSFTKSSGRIIFVPPA